MDAFLADPGIAFSEHAPRRVVSLVPSWTSSLYDLGAGSALAGITDYCPPPPAGLEIPRVGQARGPRVEQILSLKPDLVIANREENDRASIESICASGIPVWLTFPRTVKEMLADLWKASSLFRSESAPYSLEILEKSVDWAELFLQGQEPVRYFCPIWQDTLSSGETWWMTFNQDTYSSDALRLLNGKNVFAGRERKYPLLAEFGQTRPEAPGDRDVRYPRVSFEEIIHAQPEVILLPDEPYPYGKEDVARMQEVFQETPAGQTGKIVPVPGKYIHWPGTILARAMNELADLFST